MIKLSANNIDRLMDTMVSSRPKKLFYKFELFEYSEVEDKFVKMDEHIVQERKMPNGISNVSGIINYNSEQDVIGTFDIEIVNEDSINNWGADYDPNLEFKWWLDKHMTISMGLELDERADLEPEDHVQFVQMGYFLITHFQSIHNTEQYPTIKIQGSSKEARFATRRGKFLYPTTIQANTVITDTIRTLLTSRGEHEDNIKIDPQIEASKINTFSRKIDYGDNSGEWTPLQTYVNVSLDEENFVHGESSLKMEVDYEGYIEQGTVFMEREFNTDIPLNLSVVSAVALWARCSRSLPEGTLGLIMIDSQGRQLDLSFRELIGHVIEGGESVYIDNWRNIVLSAPIFEGSHDIVKIQIRANTRMFAPFTLWLDQIYYADIRNLLPYDFTYGAGENVWNAIKELGNMLDCDVFYDKYGNLHLKKRKLPKERLEGQNLPNFYKQYNVDMFEELVPKIVYNSEDEKGNLFAGVDNMFDEHELANHVQVLGGSTGSTVTNLVDISVRVDGIHMREKGKKVNSRGKVRSVDQFHANATPTIFNCDTNVAEVYKGHDNLDQVVDAFPEGFCHYTLPPISNFAIERIDHFIYHHNNADPDPVLLYTWECKNRALWEIRQRLSYAERVNIRSAPYFFLFVHDIIKIKNPLLDLNHNLEINSISIPLNGDFMNITATKMHEFMIDLPYFGNVPPVVDTCWYGYDAYALTWFKPFPMIGMQGQFPEEDEGDDNGE